MNKPNQTDCWTMLDIDCNSTTTDFSSTQQSNFSLDGKQFGKRFSLSASSYAAATTILCASSVLATPSNILVIWVVIKTPFLRSKAVNMLIVNLCLIDLVASCLDLPLIWIILQLKFNRIHEQKWICNW